VVVEENTSTAAVLLFEGVKMISAISKKEVELKLRNLNLVSLGPKGCLCSIPNDDRSEEDQVVAHLELDSILKVCTFLGSLIKNNVKLLNYKLRTEGLQEAAKSFLPIDLKEEINKKVKSLGITKGECADRLGICRMTFCRVLYSNKYGELNPEKTRTLAKFLDLDYEIVANIMIERKLRRYLESLEKKYDVVVEMEVQ